jgi:GH3 auxin-responsive promoter
MLSAFLPIFAQWRVWQLNAQRPARAQQRQLLSLIRNAAETRFGRDHNFTSIRTVKEYQDRVPLRRYEDFWNDYWKDEFPVLKDCTWPGTIPYFALTSGTTTGINKYIPVSRDILYANARAVQDLLTYHLVRQPQSRIWAGKGLVLGGSTDLRKEAPGIFSGDLSGIEANEVPWWGRPYVFPPRDLALIPDWEEKIDQIAHASLKEDIRAISGTPSWLLIYFDKLRELRPDAGPQIANYYPNLELLVHGGVDFKPYSKRFAELLDGSDAELREVYPASEAFIAIADRGQDEGLRLIVDNGVFFEFVPVEELSALAPTRHWLGDAEFDVNYAVVLSTCAGAWGYVLGDTVKFVDLDPPRVLVTGRTSYSLSAFGEHLIGVELEEAVTVAADTIYRSVADYCVAPVYPVGASTKGGHHYLVEFIGDPPDAHRLAAFARALDDRLCGLNSDYKQHRVRDYGLRAPVVEAVAPGKFAAWLKSRNQLGGQHKVPRIINDAGLFLNLKAFLLSSGRELGTADRAI